jgi:hypothetical protein
LDFDGRKIKCEGSKEETAIWKVYTGRAALGSVSREIGPNYWQAGAWPGQSQGFRGSCKPSLEPSSWKDRVRPDTSRESSLHAPPEI